MAPHNLTSAFVPPVCPFLESSGFSGVSLHQNDDNNSGKPEFKLGWDKPEGDISTRSVERLRPLLCTARPQTDSCGRQAEILLLSACRRTLTSFLNSLSSTFCLKSLRDHWFKTVAGRNFRMIQTIPMGFRSPLNVVRMTERDLPAIIYPDRRTWGSNTKADLQ